MLSDDRDHDVPSEEPALPEKKEEEESEGLFPFRLPALERVEDFLAAFWDWQTRQVSRAMSSGECLPRALVWRPYAGMGNRAYQIAPAVNFAALTSRVFVMVRTSGEDGLGMAGMSWTLKF